VYRVIARLAAGRTLSQGRAEMEASRRLWSADFPDQHRGLGVRVDSLAQAVYRQNGASRAMGADIAVELSFSRLRERRKSPVDRAVSRRHEMICAPPLAPDARA